MNPLLVKFAPYLVVLLVAGGWRYSDVRRQRAIGQLQERLVMADSALKVARADSARLAAGYRVDTVRLSRTLVKRDTVLRTVDRFLHDTVPVPVEIVRTVLAADSAVIQSCQIALGTCEERVGNAERRAALFQQERDAYRKLQPSGFQKARSTFTAALLGAAITYLIVRPE